MTNFESSRDLPGHPKLPIETMANKVPEDLNFGPADNFDIKKEDKKQFVAAPSDRRQSVATSKSFKI